MNDFCHSFCCPWGSVKPGNLFLQVNESTLFRLAKCLYIRTKKKVIYASGLLLWPLAAQNKIWFLKSKCLHLLFQLLDTKMKDMKMLDRHSGPKQVKSSEYVLPTDITRCERPEIPHIIHSLIHTSIHPSFHSLIFPFIYSFFIHLSIHWSVLMFIFSFTQYWSRLKCVLGLFKSENMARLEGSCQRNFPTKWPLKWYLKDIQKLFR